MVQTYLVVALWISTSIDGTGARRRFEVDYEKGVFLKDGTIFSYISGSIHYQRIHPSLWYDRLSKMKYAGLDAIEMYIPWNWHEIEKGVFDFSGPKDVEHFIQTAHSLDLLVILRPGPYICAEWEFGGFPYWIIKANDSIALRTSDAVYLKHVTDWFNVLLPKLRKYLYVNGGPIISVQIENEYGSYYACDLQYLDYIEKLVKSLLVDDVVLFTTNGHNIKYLGCGTLNTSLNTINFGVGNAEKDFQLLKQFNESFKGPFVNTEYYIGWFDVWGEKHSKIPASSAASSLRQMLKMNASVNMYMFHGGTNFGFTSGSPKDFPFRPVTTSYDYDGAISEAGDMTYKFQILKETIAQFRPHTGLEAPSNSTKTGYGVVNLTLQGELVHCIPWMAKQGIYDEYISVYPLRMEIMNAPYGYSLYIHEIKADVVQANLSIPGVRDMAYIMVNNVFIGMLYRDGPTSIILSAQAGDSLEILVENMGRVGYGSGINHNTKGIIANVTLGDWINITKWNIFNFDHIDSEGVKLCKNQSMLDKSSAGFSPSVFLGTFSVHQATDTFLSLEKWSKGHVEINGFNVGRYWNSKGPQKTLYIPAALLNPGTNEILVTELLSAPCSNNNTEVCQISFVDQPVL